MTREEKMTPEEAIAEISYLKVAVNKVVEQALDMAIQALSQEPTTTTNNNELITIVYPTIFCDDAISREYLKKIAQSEGAYGYVSAHDIATAPSVTVRQTETYIDGIHAMGYREGYKDAQKQKSGKWIGIDEKPHEDYECSCCGYVVSTFTANIEPHTEYKYCPNCGAKMESESDA